MLNYTIRPVLWTKKKNRQLLSPLMICVTIHRKQTYWKTPYKLRDDQWDEDKKEIRNYNGAKGTQHANILLRKQMADLEAEITTKQIEGTNVTGALLKKGSGIKQFAVFAREVRNDAKEIARVRAFAGEGLCLHEIDVAFLRRYQQHEAARGMAQNTQNTTFKFLRRILNQAKAEGLIKDNPFNEYDIPKYKQPERLYLVEEEKAALMELTGKNLSPSLHNTLCYFLLGCYSGLRHSDWLRFDPGMIHDGFLRLRTKKTKTNVVLPVGLTLARIVELIRPLDKPVSNQKCNVMLKLIANAAGLNKEITTHTARHSFGYLCACNKIPKAVTAELMGITARTVEVYYHLSGRNIIEQAAVLKTI